MTTIEKVWCAIDLTKASRNAFDRALSIARASKGRLYVLHVVPPNHPFSWQQSERLKWLTSLRERAERDGIPVRTVEQHGDPARTRASDDIVVRIHRADEQGDQGSVKLEGS